MNRTHVVMTALLVGLLAVLVTALAPAAGGDQIEVAGLVKDIDNDPIDGAKLTIYNAGTEAITTVISDEGTWSATLPTGHYFVNLGHEDYNNSFYWFEVPDEYEYPPMDVGVFRMTLLREADSMQNGTIYDSSTMARLGGAELTIWDDELDAGIGPFESTTTGVKKKRNGNYTVEYAAGSWRMSIDADGYVIKWVNIQINETSTPWINYTLDPMPEGSVVDGKVKSAATGEQLVGANVTLTPKNMTLWDDPDFGDFKATTKTLGYGVIRGVPTGTYSLVIDIEGYEAYIDNNLIVNGDRSFGLTDTVLLEPTENGEALIDVTLDDLWTATVSVFEDIMADRDIWNYTWDMELYRLWHAYGYGRVGPDAISGSGLGNGFLAADELMLVQDIQDYAGVPDRYVDLIVVRNGTQALEYIPSLTEAELDTSDWWMTWEFTLTGEDPFENVYVGIESELKYDDTLMHVYTFDLPSGWYPVRTTDEDFTFEYLANGYVISEGNGTGREGFLVDVSNDDGVPTAHISVDNEWEGAVNESVRVEFNATLAADVGVYLSGIVLYKWDFGDGEMENITKNMTKHEYDLPGIYDVTLTVVDKANHSSLAFEYPVKIADITSPSLTVAFPQVEDVIGRGDVINLTSAGGLNVTITVNATDPEKVDATYDILVQVRLKDDEDSEQENLTWDGLVPVDGNLTHQAIYEVSGPGNYSVKVTATDDSGNEGTKTTSFFVWDLVPPMADIVVKNSTKHVIDLINQTVLENELITFDASESTDNAELLKVIWEFGDGTKDKDKDDKTDAGDYNDIVKHVYHAPGTFQVNATVWDAWGNMDALSVNVTVEDNMAPEAKFTTSVDDEKGSHVDEETGVMMFNATESSDTSGAILYYVWWFGDEEILKDNESKDLPPDPSANLTTPYINHSYQDPGTFSVKLQVWDGANHSASITKTVTVVAKDKVDFTIDIVTAESSTRVRQGDKAKVTVKIYNKGKVDYKAEDYTQDLIVALITGEDDDAITRITLVITEDLPRNGSITKVLSWKPRKGTYEVRAVVDPDDLFEELKTDGSGEGNEETINLKVDAPKEQDITMYIVVTLVVVVAIIALLLWKKRQLSAMESQLHGKKESGKKKGGK